MFYQTALMCLLLGTASPTPLYLVLIPAEIRTGIEERVCVLNPYGRGENTLRLTVENELTNNTIFQHSGPFAQGHDCFRFTVGEEEIGTEYTAVLSVTVQVRGQEQERNETKRVVLKRYDTLTFVQSDKTVYKPGQTVKFRIVTLDEHFQPLDDPYPLVTIWDPDHNRIAQWHDVKAEQGIAELSFRLTQEPAKGRYNIEVQKTRGKREHHFSVEEYVLPKAEMTIEMPKRISILDSTLDIQGCTRFTYGKPVHGNVSGMACYSSRTRICQPLEQTTDPRGCVHFEVVTAPFRLRWSRYHRVIEVILDLREAGTGIHTLAVGKSEVVTDVTRITFPGAAERYKPGMVYRGKVKLSNFQDKPMANASIYLFTSIAPGAEKLITDGNGDAVFSLQTHREWADVLSFTAIYQGYTNQYRYSWIRPHHEAGELHVKPFHSRLSSYLSILQAPSELTCASRYNLTVHYLVNHLQSGKDHSLTVYYLVQSRGIIIRLDSLLVSVKNGEDGSFSFPLSIEAEMSPVAQLLVLMVHPEGETIADQTHLQITKCFRNQVSLRYSVEEELPRGSVTLELEAALGSLCALRVVDQSVMLLRPEEELNAESVYALLPVHKLSGYSYRVDEWEASQCSSVGYLSEALYNEDLGDVAHLLKEMGLKILTDSEYRRPVECIKIEPRYSYHSIGEYGERMMSIPGIAHDLSYSPPLSVGLSRHSAERVRHYFPETWVWELVRLGSESSRSIPVIVPDSITEWKAGAFCTGPSGFGISEPSSLTAFKPFFVELVLPYSVVRTESFTLKAKVFNYLKECIMVKVSLLQAGGFNVTGEHQSHQHCLCSQESHTVSWPLTSTGLGKQNITVRAESIPSESLCGNEVVIVPQKGAVDIVQKPLLIKAEGVETELTHSSFICPSGGRITEEMEMVLPENVVEGSVRGDITVLGDLLGSAMENIDQLLRLPTGCGEQNMVMFAPNVYIQKYLIKTHQLTEEIRDRAVTFLRAGYQNQLSYKHGDGSFSAFGTSDSEGNAWLTAFVLRSFVQARRFIFIDEEVLEKSVSFFLENRLESGCFAQRGSLFNNAMKGGVEDQYTLCAYITSALGEFQNLESDMAEQIYTKWQESTESPSTYNSELSSEDTTTLPPTNRTAEKLTFKDGVISRALRSLASEVEGVNGTYALALLAYTFTVAGDLPTRGSLLERLRLRAVEEGGLTHWKREDSEDEEEEIGFWWRASSAEVEMTSYVLLALLSGPEVTKSELDRATSIVSWLVRQRNAYGGFASTQDTVVALQALSLYATLTHVPNPDSTVTLTSPSGSQTTFRVTSSNKLLLQRQSLSEIPGKYTAEVTGSSCLLLESTLHYNIPPAQKDPAFNVSTHVTHSTASNYNLEVTLSYIGQRSLSNMVILDVAVLSGFAAKRLTQDHTNVSRSEMKDDHLILYLEPMKRDLPLHLSLTLSHDFDVTNIQPAPIRVYDYYEIDDSVIVEYNAPEQIPGDPEVSV